MRAFYTFMLDPQKRTNLCFFMLFFPYDLRKNLKKKFLLPKIFQKIEIFYFEKIQLK